jgi:uncharacterized protein with HEPN domain
MKTDAVYVRHMLDAIQQIHVYTQDGKTAFLGDRKTQDAVLRNIEIVGEAAKRVSSALKARTADLPWKQISGMRDKVIHDYFGVNLQLVWETTQGSMRVLAQRLEAILREIDQQRTLPLT